MVAQPNEQELIDAGSRVRAFVEDEAVQAAIARTAAQNYADFKTATTPADLLKASAKASVLDDFIHQLQITIDRGEAAGIQRKDREHREGIVS